MVAVVVVVVVVSLSVDVSVLVSNVEDGARISREVVAVVVFLVVDSSQGFGRRVGTTGSTLDGFTYIVEEEVTSGGVGLRVAVP